MQLSLNWLKDFVDIPKNIAPADLAAALTMHTVEVEGVKNQAEKFNNVVVGKILEIKKHPNADRLRLARVDVGPSTSSGRGEILNIVCGAPNIEVGQLVPVALIGAILPNGLEIKEAEVRGEKSFGMMCAPDELGLGDNHDGIIILDKKAKIGQSLANYLELKDIILEVDNKSLSNRPDLWSHYGMAREISAFLGSRMKNEFKTNLANFIKSNKIDKKSEVELKCKVEDFDLCPRYMAIAMDGIKIENSPKWMEERLIAAGVRPINNIVDITNYVLLELGQPMHAFDASRIKGESRANSANIVVRAAKNGETMETLDEEKRKLDKNDVVITDGKKPVALGGVMGGANSEISSETKSIIIESANFNPVAIRKTSTKLGLRTESSARFEKGLDPNLSETALIRAVELVKKLCPKAKVVSDLIDEKKFKLNQGPIELDLDWLEKKIGENIGEKKVIGILESLGFVVKTQKNAFLQIIVPTWRSTGDISIKEDIAEEIIRIYGYGNLKSSMPKIEMGQPEINEERIFERKLKRILAGAPALIEVYNYSFVGEEALKKLNINPDSHVKLANPIAALEALLRQSLAPHLFNNIKDNQANFSRIAIFETGFVFFSFDGDILKDETGKTFLPYQEKRLAIAYSEGGVDVFRKAKGIADYLLSSLGLEAVYVKCGIKPGWAEENVCADIIVGGKNIGTAAKLSSSSANKINIKKPVALAEINFKELFNFYRAAGIKKYKAMEKYPPVIRDLSFVVEANIMYNDIRHEIISFSQTIKEVELFDVYEGGKLGANKKSLAFHIVYQADRTLTSEEVDKLQKGLIKNLEKKFGAKIRNF